MKQEEDEEEINFFENFSRFFYSLSGCHRVSETELGRKENSNLTFNFLPLKFLFRFRVELVDMRWSNIIQL
jgi:hypothetical protein